MGSIASTVRGDDEVQVVARTRSPSHDDGVERTWFERFDFLYPDILFEIEGAADLLEERPFSLENLQLDDSDFEIDVTRNMFDNEAERGERLERERVDIMEVIEAFEAAEIIAGLSTRRASLSACDPGKLEIIAHTRKGESRKKVSLEQKSSLRTTTV